MSTSRHKIALESLRHLVTAIAAIGCTALMLTPVHAATREGTITYEGKVPKIKALKMDADPDCLNKHTSPPPAEYLVLGDGNTMGNIFVAIKSGLPDKEYPAPSSAAIIDQKGCIYDPHVIGLMAGQPLKFKNSDGILHNVHALPKINRPFNMAMPGTMTESSDKGFKKVEEKPFKIKCDVHPWMNTWVRVMSHPYFSVTSTDGKYKIDNLPAGTYEVEAWHEKLGFRTQEITVAEGDSAKLDFKFTRTKG